MFQKSGFHPKIDLKLMAIYGHCANEYAKEKKQEKEKNMTIYMGITSDSKQLFTENMHL